MQVKGLRGAMLLMCLCLFGVNILYSTASAADKAKCEQYAKEAVAQQKKNIQMGCGFVGIAWHEFYPFHYDWCLTAKPETVDKESANRKALLEQCLHPKMKPPPIGTIPLEIPEHEFKTKEQMCTDYAKGAVLQANENKKQNCGYGGDSWSTDQKYHYNWCMKYSDLAKDEYTERQSDLKKCMDMKTCQQYAKKAVDQNQKNLQDGCGFVGARWVSDYSHHYNWCMTDKHVEWADQETKFRSTHLAKCALIKPLDGNFKIQSIKPAVDNNGVVGQVQIVIEANSSKNWAIGDFGHNQYGSLWIELTTTNKIWHNGLVQDEIYNNLFSISTKGILAGTQPLVSPPIGTNYQKGKSIIKLVVHPYPYIKLTAIQLMASIWVGPFEPGALACWHYYPEMTAKVHIFTTSGFKYHKKTVAVMDSPMITKSIDRPSGGIVYYQCK